MIQRKDSGTWLMVGLGLVLWLGSCSDPRLEPDPDNGCALGLEACSGSCVNVFNDERHCGQCGAACASSQICIDGQCRLSCQAGRTECAGRCVDLATDQEHCGACGQSCGGTCSGGTCTLLCAAGQLVCGSRCVNPQSDPGFCGASGDCQGERAGQVCPVGQSCLTGQCVLACPAGFVECAGRCVDPRFDPAYCGAQGDCQGENAGSVCGAGSVCSLGSCSASCPPGFVVCAGRCIDPTLNPSYCGAGGDCIGENAGVSCAAGRVCSAGRCALSCQSGLIVCAGLCTDPQTDARYCGASGDCSGAAAGQRCQTGEVCAAGQCAVNCQSGRINCNGLCIDPNTDRNYCGAQGDCQGTNLGVSCGAGMVCASGQCSVVCQQGQVNCNGACIDPMTDRGYCGAQGDCLGQNAGVDCTAPGAQCTSGVCSCVVGGLLRCNNACINPASDAAYCGAQEDCLGPNAGVACLSSERCVEGACLGNDPGLSDLLVDGIAFDTSFSPQETFYTATVSASFGTAQVTATSADGNARIQINGAAVGSGEPSSPIELFDGINYVTVDVVAPAGASRTYVIAIRFIQTFPGGDGGVR